MANLLPPAYANLYDPAQVRLNQLGEALLAAEAEVLPTDRIELAVADLFQGLDALAVEADPGHRELLGGYLNEVYGLLSVGLDPFLRAALPPLSAGGNQIRYKVRGINGKVRLFNNALLIARSAELLPA